MMRMIRWAATSLVLAACGSESPGGPDATGPADGRDEAADGRPDADPAQAPDAGPPLGEWSGPQRIEVLSDAARELSPTVTADGLELWFLRLTNFNPNPTVWRSRRTALDQPWAAPEEVDVPAVATVIEIAPDGLEMFSNRVGGEVVAMRRPTRDAAWPAAMEAAFDGSEGALPTLGDDGLTAFYLDRTLAAAFVKRQRATVEGAWGQAAPAEIDYERPPREELELAARYRSFDLRNDTVLLTDPSAGSGLPSVAELTQLPDGSWSALREVSVLSSAGLLQCDLASRTEAICAIDNDGDGVADDLARITRDVAR